jgi:hypothetical protein
MDPSRAIVGVIAILAARCRSAPIRARKRHCAPRALETGRALVVGWHTRIAATCGGLVLILFGLAMTAALGPEAPLSFSVFSAAAAASGLLAVKPPELLLGPADRLLA